MFHRVVVKRDLSLARPGSGCGNRLAVSKSFIIFEMCLTDVNLYIYTRRRARRAHVLFMFVIDRNVSHDKNNLPIKPNAFPVT